jgi:hypothetical protein
MKSFVRGPGFLAFVFLCGAGLVVIVEARERAWDLPWLFAAEGFAALCALVEIVSGRGLGGRPQVAAQYQRESAAFAGPAVAAALVLATVAGHGHPNAPRLWVDFVCGAAQMYLACVFTRIGWRLRSGSKNGK